MKRLFYLVLLGLIIFAGCATERENNTAEETESQTVLLGRPRFEKPVVRPLGLVLLTWNAVNRADGYELQTSKSKDFETISGSWTISGTSIELPVDKDIIIWYRVRSFGGDSAGRWSAPLRISERDLR